jgi:CO dehydrogenase maturation factor
MTTTFALAGKGGTGKTTIAGLLVRALLRADKKPVLAIDADPNATLGEALGLQPDLTVVGAVDKYFGERANIPAGMSRDKYLEQRLAEVICESKGFDLLVMGRPEGAGCYCAANNVLRASIDALTHSYVSVVMDNEAGMEHLSRRTTRSADHLILVSDHSVRGVRTVARLSALAAELELGIGKRWLVLNRAPAQVDLAVEAAAKECGLPIALTLPTDPAIGKADLTGTSLLELGDDSPAASGVAELLRRLTAA